MFDFAKLPLEIQYTILGHCDSRTVCSLLAVCRGMNRLVEDMMSHKIQQFVGRSAGEPKQSIGNNNRGVLIRVFTPDNELLNNRNYWLDTCYVCTARNQNSCPSSSFVVGPSRVWRESGAEGYETLIEMSEDDEFTQIVLQISIGLDRCQNLPLPVIRRAQRIHKNWNPCEDRIIHNKELTYRLRVDPIITGPRRNEFNELVHPFKVTISEIAFNTAYLLDRLDSVRDSSTIFSASGGRFINPLPST